MPNTLRTKNIAREPCFSFSSSVLGGFVSFSSSVLGCSGFMTITVVAAVVLFLVLLLPLLTLEFENDHNKSV